MCAVFLLIFGACILYELLGDNYNDIRRKVSWNNWRKTDELLAIHHLNKLSEKYPDLEITYKETLRLNMMRDYITVTFLIVLFLVGLIGLTLNLLRVI